MGINRKAKKTNSLKYYIYIPFISIILLVIYILSKSDYNIRKQETKSGPVNVHTPGKLQWYDSFKGISNNKEKKQTKEDKKNFINFK